MARDVEGKQGSGDSRSLTCRFRKFERLLRSADFVRVFRRGRCFRARALRIHFHEGRTEFSRMGLVVSRKMGRAVVRNKVKRRLREVFRTSKARLTRPLDLVFVGNPRFGPASHAVYLETFERFLEWLRAREAAVEREGPAVEPGSGAESDREEG